MSELLKAIVTELAVKMLADQGGEATQEQIESIANHEVKNLRRVAQYFPHGPNVLARIAELLTPKTSEAKAAVMLKALKIASDAFVILSGQTDQNVVDVLNGAEKEVNFAIQFAEGDSL